MMWSIGYCLCGCNLQTGSLLIGIWNTVSSVVLFGVCIYVGETSKHNDLLRVLMILYSVCHIVVAGFGIVLIVGAVKKLRILLKIWTVFAQAYVGLNVVGIVMTVSNGVNIYAIVGVVVNIALTIYFALVVDNLRLELLNPNADCELSERSEPQLKPANVKKV